MTAADTPSREELRLAELFWRHEAEGVPALKNARDQHAFTDQSETTQARWLGYARVALAAKSADDDVREATIEEVAQRIFAQLDPLARKGRHEIQRRIRALSTKAKP